MESQDIVRPAELACLKEKMCLFMHAGLHENHKEESLKCSMVPEEGRDTDSSGYPCLFQNHSANSHRLLSVSVMLAVGIISAL